MDPGEIAKSIWEQFVTVGNAPVPFIAAVLFSGWLIWLAVRREYATRLANADSTQALLERQLQDYKDKLSGATPDEARARLDALEARIDAMGPRRLTAEQRQRMAVILDQHKGRAIEITSDASSADATQLARGLALAFNGSGWHTQTATALGIGNPPASGVGIIVPNPASLAPEQHAVAQALTAAGLAYDIQQGNLRQPNPFERPKPVAEILLTSRLED